MPSGDAKSLLDAFGEGSFEGVVLEHDHPPHSGSGARARRDGPAGRAPAERCGARPGAAGSHDEIARLADLYAGSETPAARAPV